MKTQNCSRCGKWHQSAWKHCDVCQTINPDLEHKDMLVVRGERDIKTTPVIDTTRVQSATILKTLLSLDYGVEGQLLAIVQQGNITKYVLRVPTESTLEALRAELERVQTAASVAHAEHAKFREQYDALRLQVDDALKKAQIEGETRKALFEKSMAISNIARRLEADIAKIREAIGSERMKEILSEGPG